MANGFNLLIFLFLICPYITSGDYYTSVSSKLDQVIYKYMNHIRSENEVGLCKPGNVCGVVNKRFWLPSVVYRICRCPKFQCPFEWNKSDNLSVPLDNRSQLKTCENTNYMEPCKEREIGLSVIDKEGQKEEERKREISLKCRCDWPAYWKLSRHLNNLTTIQSEYTCAKLYKCQQGDFCGHIRSDTYSTYYQCSCPKGNLCINTDRVLRNVTELLYIGPVYRAYCMPYSETDNSTN